LQQEFFFANFCQTRIMEVIKGSDLKLLLKKKELIGFKYDGIVFLVK